MIASNTRPPLARNINYCLDAIKFYEPTLRAMTEDELKEYAVNRLLRDHYVKHPKALAADIHKYHEDYEQWWERWRLNK